MEEVEQEQKFVDVSPVTKLKRSLAFLADYFLIFIAAITLFNLAAMPLGKLITNYAGVAETSYQAEIARDGVLYNHELLFTNVPGKKLPTDFNSNLEYTAKVFLFPYVDGENPLMEFTLPDCEETDVFHRYFVTIRGESEEAYSKRFLEADKAKRFFGETGLILNPTIREEFSHLYIPGDGLSTQGKADYEDFQSKFFLPFYQDIISSAIENDLTYNDVHYAKEYQTAQQIVILTRNLAIVGALVSYLVAVALVGILPPMISRTRRTLGMIFLRREKVDVRLFKPMKRGWALMHAVYLFATCASCLFFLPMGIYDFVSLFSLPVLLPISIVSLVFLLGSFIFLLFNGFNRTLTDFLLGVIMIDEETLDEIYRAKGYDF